MKLRIRENKKSFVQRGLWVIGIVWVALLSAATNGHAAAAQKSFATADEAVKTAVAAARSNSDKDLLAIFGTQAKDLLSSGDPVADKERRANFLAAYDQKNRLVTEGENTILVIGNNDWPFPIPLVKKSEGWVFDPAKGREEILNRRIGQNELDAIQVTLAYVDAQREYAMKVRGKEGLRSMHRSFGATRAKKMASIGKRKRARSKARSVRLPPGQEAKATKREISRFPIMAITTKSSRLKGKTLPAARTVI